MTYINLFIIVIANILVFSLIGQQLFSNRFDSSTERGQLHSFDSFFKSFLTIFNILTNDDWYGVLELGTFYSNKYITIIYMFFLVFILNLLTIGILIAILLDGFVLINVNENENENY